MKPEAPSYFTCTLSEALAHNKANHDVRIRQHGQGMICEHEQFRNIDEFVSFLAENYGQHLAAGCIIPDKTTDESQKPFIDELLSFAQIDEQTSRLGQHFRNVFGLDRQRKQCVALIASSSIVFLLTWLGLMRAGYEVLLISPQNSSEAIAHLLRLSKAVAICFDHGHATAVSDALNGRKAVAPESGHKGSNSAPSQSIQQFEMQWKSIESLLHCDLEITGSQSSTPESAIPESIAFYRHSSGTTGLPKLIPQTHHGAVGVLPRLQKHVDSQYRSSTFTTTPLYSGGIADLLRSWSAASPLWIFPESKMPIAARHVASCIDRIDEISQNASFFPVTKLQFLSCVPFVLEAIIESAPLKERIRRLAAVGVGGAAMPRELGDKVVADGINLVSRFGSSECGFLLTSERDYAHDGDWHLLRYRNQEGLKFKRMTDGRHELIVELNWPFVSVATHAQRPFNTHDVFTPHDTIPGAWNYVGRSDAQLTLSTAKKFDPVPIEEALRRSELIQDAVVIGDDRPFPAAVIFRSDDDNETEHDDVLESIWDHIRLVNASSPSHARLEKTYLCLLPSTEYSRVRKNSKGGLIRSAFVSDFSQEIGRIYDIAQEEDNERSVPQTPTELHDKIRSLVLDSLDHPKDLKSNHDLFEAGMDSAKSILIRKQICSMLPSRLRPQVPLGVIYECGTINALTQFVLEVTGHTDKTNSANQARTDKLGEMHAMVEEYTTLQQSLFETNAKQSPSVPATQSELSQVILTGATGFLGTHILQRLLSDNAVSRIYVFMRGSHFKPHLEQHESAKFRIEAALKFRQLFDDIPDTAYGKLIYVPFHLKNSSLGLSPDVYSSLTSQATHIIHAAWDVNFNLPLKTFAPQIEGVVNLYNLLLHASRSQNRSNQTAPRLIFCSSTASTAHAPDTTKKALQRSISSDAHDAADLGYAQSKWVAEHILSQLIHRSPGVDVTILRVGQLSGATLTGIWNAREAWPLMISAGLRMSYGTDSGANEMLLPDLAATGLPAIDWLPVDAAAERVCADMGSQKEVNHSGFNVSPVANRGSDDLVPWAQMQEWIAEWAGRRNMAARFVEADVWLGRLESSSGEDQAKVLIPLWRKNWTQGQVAEKYERSVPQREEKNAPRAGLLDKEYIWRVLDWIAEQ